MKRSCYTTALISLGFLGCMHGSPEERILAAFSGLSGERLFSGETPPQYLMFRDEASASVFRNLTGDGTYRMAPTGQPLFCPGVPENGNHGYLLGAKVDTVMGDSAFATITRDCTQFVAKCASGQLCASFGGTVEYQTSYLLARIERKWRVIRAVNGAFVTPM